MTPKHLNIGFISFRFQGTDGVSLETSKWAEVLEGMGHTCYYFSGLSDRPEERSMVVDEAYFRHKEIRARYHRFFTDIVRTADDTAWIHSRREYFRDFFLDFIKKFDLDVLIPQNLLSFPQNIPLTLALTEIIAETEIPVIAHHHDFTWERKPLLVNSVDDYISMAFPPDLPSVQHVVINSIARHQLARRKGVSSTLIPNVMDFGNPPTNNDGYADDIRETLGLEDDELFILQPTRVVQRKGIEHAIELVSRLNRKACLVVSHASGDDGYEYEERIKDYAKLMGVKLMMAAEHFDEERRTSEDGRKIYSLWDAYPHADLVTYPSMIEGFGNAFLEALYFKRPIVVNNYSIYATDIRPKGFNVIEFDEYITEDTIEQTRKLLDDKELELEMCKQNYELARRHFSYTILRNKLKVLLDDAFGANNNNH
ncbi:MAG: glycosyltransferase [Chloroflexi bacterium]|nr:MAG: glycosyltransferase [Chloroflexota bacterium]MBL1194002.1 glycosyltransferase [Chloroflexota bacterium]NOH11296.1 glycosyltransferase family 4 protein [Chloroflexota bacterium]